MDKGKIVFSAFDGMSCGQIALERADNLKRKFIGIELDETYFNVTLNRFNKKDNQQELF